MCDRNGPLLRNDMVIVNVSYVDIIVIKCVASGLARPVAFGRGWLRARVCLSDWRASRWPDSSIVDLYIFGSETKICVWCEQFGFYRLLGISTPWQKQCGRKSVHDAPDCSMANWHLQIHLMKSLKQRTLSTMEKHLEKRKKKGQDQTEKKSPVCA